MTDLSTKSTEELIEMLKGSSPAEQAGPTQQPLSEVPTWKLLEMSGQYSDYDYELPSDKMYDQITGDNYQAEAEALYNKYADSPYSEDTMKGKMYKGVRIPGPDLTLNKIVSETGKMIEKFSPVVAGVRNILPDQHLDDNPVSVSMPQVIVDSISDIPGELAELGAAGVDKAAELIGWGNPGLTDAVQDFQAENLPKTRLEKPVSRFTKEASQMAVGSGAAFKALKAAGPIIRNAGMIIAGAATRDDEDTETLLFGKGSLLGADLNPTSPEETDEAKLVLQRRLNLLMDDALLGTLAEGAVRGSVLLGKTAWGVTVGRALPWASKSKRELKVMEHVASMLRLADGAASPQEQSEILRRLGKYMVDNQELLYKIPDDEIEDVVVKLDSMSVLRRAGDEVSDVTKDNAAILARKGDQTSSIAEAADNMTSDVMDSLGRNTPEQTKNIITDIADTEVSRGFDNVVDAEQALTSARQNLKRRLQNDPTFGESLEKVGKQFDILADDLDYKNTERLTDSVIDAFVDSRQKLNDLASKVKRSGGNVAVPERGKLDVLIKKAADESEVSRGILSRLNKASNSAVDWAMEVRPMLSAEISRIYKMGAKSGADASYLVAIRDEIDNQLKTLAESDGVRKSAVGNAYQEFYSYFAEKHAPVWSDGILGDAAAALKDSPLTRFGRQDKNTLKAVDDAVAEGLPEFRFGPQFVEEMRNMGKSTDDIRDFVIGKAVRELRKKIKPGTDIEDIPIGLLSEKLTDYGAMFKEVDEGLTQSINKYLQDIQNGVLDINAMKEGLDDLEKEALRIEKSYKGSSGVFGDFFRSSLDPENAATKFRPVDDASEAMQNIFKDPKSSMSKIKDIIKETSIRGEPDQTVLRGLQVSWIDALRREMIDKSTGSFNVRGAKLLLDDDTVTSFLNLGEEIFKDKPELFALHKTILRDAMEENMSLSKQLKHALSSKSVDTDIANAAHVLTTWTFGVLNRTAARVRSGAGAVLSMNPKAGSVDAIYQQILNDPEYFAEQVTRLADSLSRHGRMSDETKAILWDVMTRVQTVGTADYERKDDRRLFNDVLREVQTELAMQDGRNQATKRRKERRDN